MYLILETLELLKSAIHAVLLDDGFDVPSTPARKATEPAKCVLTWCEDDENIEVLECFADELVHLLQSCLRPRLTTNQAQSKERGKMWSALHQLRNSLHTKHCGQVF